MVACCAFEATVYFRKNGFSGASLFEDFSIFTSPAGNHITHRFNTVPQIFSSTILILRIRKITLGRNTRSTKIRKCDLFVELDVKLRTIRFARASLRLSSSILGNMALVTLLEEEEIRNTHVHVYEILLIMYVMSGDL